MAEITGQSTFEAIGIEVGQLVAVKNAAYGSSFEKSGDILKILYPNGVSPEQYQDMLAIVRLLDKFFRIATDVNALAEDPRKDIVGYGILMVDAARKRAKHDYSGT